MDGKRKGITKSGLHCMAPKRCEMLDRGPPRRGGKLGRTGGGGQFVGKNRRRVPVGGRSGKKNREA